MEKPDSLRAAITAVLPDIQKNPDKLSMYVIDGSVKANVKTLGHDISYTLIVTLVDFIGSQDLVNCAIVRWAQVNQPELLGNRQTHDDFNFEVDILDEKTVDLAIRLRLSERITALEDDDGHINIKHNPAVQESDLHYLVSGQSHE